MPADEPTVTRGSQRLRGFLLVLLGVLAAISLERGCLNAIANSNDFQWSGAHLLLQHIDPWHQYLIGDPNHLIIKIQIPNYLPLLYVLLAPLGLLPFTIAKFVWLGLNIFFGVASAVLCGRFYGLKALGCTVLVLLFLISTPLRNSIGLGQQSLLILFFFAVALCHSPRLPDAFTLGLSYAKYSFAPPVFFYLMFEMGPVAAILSVLPAVVCFLLVYLWLGGGFPHPAAMLAVLISPLKVANSGYFGAAGPNLMDLADYALKHAGAPLWLDIAGGYVLPILLAGGLLYLFSTQPERHPRPTRLALFAILSVSLFKHHNYDHVMLIFPAAYALSHWRQPTSRVVLALLCVSWYADRLLDPLFSPISLNALNFMVLVAMAVFVYRNSATALRENAPISTLDATSAP